MFVLGRRQNQLRQKGCQNLLQADASESYGTPRCDCFAPCKKLCACPTNAKHVTECITVNSVLYALGPPRILSMKGFLVRTSYLRKCVDMEVGPSPCCLTIGTPRQGVYSRSPPKGWELNDALQLSVTLHCVLPFPANRINKAYISIWHVGS